MVAIPFPVSSAPGTHSAEAQGRLINCFAEAMAEGAGAPVKRIRSPGLTSFLTSSETHFRGMFLNGSTLYMAYEGELKRGTSAGGAMTSHSTTGMSGTESCYFAINNNSPVDFVMVNENGAFTISGASTISSYPDADLPQPNCLCSINGYFVFTIGNGEVWASDLNNTSVDPLSFGDANVKPDTPVRPISYAGRLLIFGTQSLEIWQDVGASPFPFQRSVTVPFGLIGRDAIAGWEDGWGSGLLWVADDYTVRQLDGYTPVKVSSPDLDRLIARDTDKDHLLASVYMVDGHAMWTITGVSFSWTYDITTKKWHERMSYLDNRWRGLQTFNAFGKWLIGDRGRWTGLDTTTGDPVYEDDGNVYQIDATNHMEATEPLVMRVESAPVVNFPQRMRVPRADFHMDTGVGIATGDDPIQTDPTMMISYSDDGGITWSDPVHKKMGRQSVDKLISVFRTGMTRRHGRRWRVDISDPVYVALLGGDQAVQQRGPGG